MKWSCSNMKEPDQVQQIVQHLQAHTALHGIRLTIIKMFLMSIGKSWCLAKPVKHKHTVSVLAEETLKQPSILIIRIMMRKRLCKVQLSSEICFHSN